MGQIEGLEHLFEERDAHQAVISNAPVGQDRLDTWERIQVHLLGVLTRIGCHERRNHHVAARLVDGTIIQAVSVPCHCCSLQEATVGIGGAHILLLEPFGNNGNVCEELVKGLATVIVIGIKALECSSQCHMSLSITTAINNRRVVIHELNLVGSVIGSITGQRDFQSCDGLDLNFGIEFMGLCIQCRGRLRLVSHQPTTV